MCGTCMALDYLLQIHIFVDNTYFVYRRIVVLLPEILHIRSRLTIFVTFLQFFINNI